MSSIFDIPLITQHLRENSKCEAIACLEEVVGSYRKAKIINPTKIKYSLNVLRRCIKKPELVKKLSSKINRLDNDTIEILKLKENETPTFDLIKERILILENHKKLRANQNERYLCGCLRLIYAKYSKRPLIDDYLITSDKSLRKFVISVLSKTDVIYPNSEHHGKHLDDWIRTDVSPTSKELHHQNYLLLTIANNNPLSI